MSTLNEFYDFRAEIPMVQEINEQIQIAQNLPLLTDIQNIIISYIEGSIPLYRKWAHHLYDGILTEIFGYKKELYVKEVLIYRITDICVCAFGTNIMTLIEYILKCKISDSFLIDFVPKSELNVKLLTFDGQLSQLGLLVKKVCGDIFELIYNMPYIGTISSSLPNYVGESYLKIFYEINFLLSSILIPTSNFHIPSKNAS